MFLRIRRKKWFGLIGILVQLPVIFSLGSCRSWDRTYTLSDLEGKDPAVRIMAIRWAGENNVKEALPLLVERLSEEDESVRFFAIFALKRITGEDKGYDYKADIRNRRESVQRWRKYIGE